MNEEEKEAIEKLDYELTYSWVHNQGISKETLKLFKDIIEKQQREIQELKGINAIQEYRIEDIDPREFISKDKIRKLIKEKSKTDTYNFKTIAVKDIEELLVSVQESDQEGGQEENELILAQDKAQDKAQDEIVNEKISNMNEEEKKAIEYIKKELEDEKKHHNHIYKGILGLYDNGSIEIILNLVEKQQKEIEQLDKKFQYAVPVDVINDLYINKDKIRKIIEEYLPDDEIMEICSVYDVNGILIREKLEKLLGE